jgi:hypothetical protein
MRKFPRSAALRISRVAIVMLMSGLLGGCGLSEFTDAFSSNLTGISLGGPSLVQVGDTVRLTAMGSVSGLIGIFGYDRILDGRFTVSDPTIATIVPFTPPPTDTTSFESVLVEGRQVGTVQVTVTARGFSGTHSVNVVAQAP